MTVLSGDVGYAGCSYREFELNLKKKKICPVIIGLQWLHKIHTNYLHALKYISIPSLHIIHLSCLISRCV